MILKGHSSYTCFSMSLLRISPQGPSPSNSSPVLCGHGSKVKGQIFVCFSISPLRIMSSQLSLGQGTESSITNLLIGMFGLRPSK